MTYQLAPAPKLAANYAYSCTECGHEELGRPVFLTNGNGPTAYGTGCAAKLLGLPLAELRAQIAIDDLRQLAATHPHVATCWAFFLIARPGRITPKFLEVAANHAGAPANRQAVLDTVTAAYKAMNAARLNPRDITAASLS